MQDKIAIIGLKYVEHDVFMEHRQNEYEDILIEPYVLMDVKGIVPFPTWRL